MRFASSLVRLDKEEAKMRNKTGVALVLLSWIGVGAVARGEEAAASKRLAITLARSASSAKRSSIRVARMPSLRLMVPRASSRR